MRQVTRLTQPAVEAVEVEDLDIWTGASVSDVDGTLAIPDSGLLEGLIADAREMVENYLGRVLLTSTWRYLLDAVDIEDEIVLPRPPLVSVQSITATDYLDTATVVDPATVYTVLPSTETGRVFLKYGMLWLNTTLRDSAALQIDFTAGYGPDGSDIPAECRVAIKALVMFYYTNRGAGFVTNRQTGGNTPVPDEVAKIFERVDHLRVRRQD